MSQLNINEDAQSGGECSGSQSSSNIEPPTSQNHEGESAFPDEDEDTITMLDVIEREDKLEEEASAVLGNSDERNCTYPEGYVARQALYSCATCYEESGEMAALCLACSLECHDNHDLFELYTKRNYRCDCGNKKFKEGFECKLTDRQEKKAQINENNKYNHNFIGKYCTCDKRYPPDVDDTSAESNDEMYQCIACEDWYHGKHLGVEELPSKFDEMICSGCVKRLEFVDFYRDIDKIDDAIKRLHRHHQTTKEPQAGEQEKPTVQASLDELSTVVTERVSAEQLTESTTNSDDKATIFWADCSWREKLCRCESCLAMYKQKDCEYLLDERDTVQYYEAQGKVLAKDRATPFERGMTALNNMGSRAAVVEALHGYDELRADLSSYLRKFADTKQVVRESDIHEFFAQLKSKKRARLEYD